MSNHAMGKLLRRCPNFFQQSLQKQISCRGYVISQGSILHSNLTSGTRRPIRWLRPECEGQLSTHKRSVHMSTSKNAIIEKSSEGTIVNSPRPEINMPSYSFAEFVFHYLDKHKDNVATVDHMTDRSFTSSWIKESAVRVASGLRRLGLRQGDTVLVFCSNSPEYTVITLACAALGLVISTANPVYTVGELARQLGHSTTKAIVTMPELVPTAKRAVNSSKELADSVRWMITIGGQAEGCVPFTGLLEDDGKAFPENVDIDPENDVLFLPYSSGTTGLPKGVMLTHKNIIANILQFIKGPMALDPDREVLMGLLPFYHIYGLVVIQFGATCLGTKLVTLPKFEPETFLGAIQKHKVSFLHLVPPVVLFLAKSPLVNNYDVSSIHSIICGAAPLGEGLTEEASARLNCHVIQAYGLTETSPIILMDQAPPKLGTIGQLVSNTQAKMIDVDSGACLGPGGTGELLVRGPQVMKGYLNNQEATNSTIRDGWLHTGDIGHYDEEGYITITERLKELIKYKGFQVPPAELEALLLTHPSIQDAAVIGVEAGEDVGEVPRAFVVTKPKVQLSEEDVIKFVKENVTHYKRLRGGVKFMDAIPKTASGKILRRQLKGQ
ncbi:probable 4-coumarate--CoA ligase 5 [Pecten maximus]|uniref:probable 4-coumarate--CoA ligase 5 n=1 Tax=Pecten maximus TaxID=6579 RepID=UPI0014582755|nr:probable 4-coumarate--CoA ligase 5 [Pecten maximus]XP_033752288.1 probable 4-coumarate--CoA ligase 5 [Pecten maximus]XP_033752289.1 probable 4-coumarate--CoA ligase 5 [Pecten maximus]